MSVATNETPAAGDSGALDYSNLPPAVKRQMEAEARRAAEVQGQPQPAPAPVAQPQPAPAAQTPPQPTPAPSPAPAPAQGENWEHKYRSVEGRINALTAENRSLKAEIIELKKDIEAVADDLVACEAERDSLKASHAAVGSLTKEDEEAFGADTIAAMRRAASEVAAPLEAKVRGLEAENKKLRENVTKTVESSAEERRIAFEKRLYELVPDFDAYNVAGSEFVQWVQQPSEDNPSGPPRIVALRSAADRYDADAVARYVEIFKRTQGQSEPQPQPTPTPAPQPAQSRVPLESFAAPAPVRQSSPDVVEDEYYLESVVKGLVADIAKGKWNGRMQEAQALREKHLKAYAEGKVLIGR